MTTLCNLLKITRTDTVELGITDLDIDVIYDGLTYRAISGYTPTNYSSNDQLSVNSADVEGLLSSVGVTRDDIRAGLYDGARIDCYVYDYVAETLSKYLAAGYWGEATVNHGSGRYVAEFRSLAHKLQQPIGEVVSPLCLAEFGDSLTANRCKLVLATYTTTGAVDSTTDSRHFVDATLSTVGQYNGGVVTWTSGLNDGYSMEVKGHAAGGSIELFLAMPNSITIADTFSISQGCDKTLATCRDTYDNVINRRAFDYLPGERSLTERAGL